MTKKRTKEIPLTFWIFIKTDDPCIKSWRRKTSVNWKSGNFASDADYQKLAFSSVISTMKNLGLISHTLKQDKTKTVLFFDFDPALHTEKDAKRIACSYSSASTKWSDRMRFRRCRVLPDEC